jgi:outer membrane protein
MHALLLFLVVTDVGLSSSKTPQPTDMIGDSVVTDVAARPVGTMNTADTLVTDVQARQVDFTEALQLAAAQNPAIAAARADAAVVRASVRRAAGAWQPDLIANGTYDHTTAAQYLNYGQIIPPALALQAANSTYGTLTLTQPFFSPQGIFGLQPAQAAARAAELGADEAREQLLLGVARAYLGALGIEELNRAAADAEEVAHRREADAQAHLKAGSGTPISLLRAQSETLRAHSQVESLRAQYQDTLALLEAGTGEPVLPRAGSEIQLSPPGEQASEPWMRTFRVRSAQKAVEAAEGALRLDDVLWLPTVAGQIRGSYNSNTGFQGTHTYADLGVSVTIPLYDHGQRYAAAAEDSARLSAARSRLADAVARARAAWIAARADSQAALALLEQAEAQFKVAGQAQAQVETGYHSGVATNLELSDADAQRFFAQSTVAQLRAALNLRRAEVAAAEGRLYQELVQR